MQTKLRSDDGSAVIDFVLTSMPVFAAFQFVLGLLAFYGTAFFDTRVTIVESGLLAMADRDNRSATGYAFICKGNPSFVFTPRICWHNKLEPSFLNASLSR